MTNFFSYSFSSSSSNEIEICYFDMEDENMSEASVSLVDTKQNLLRKINLKLASSDKTVLILLDNFNYLFTNSDNLKISTDILNELFCLKRKYG